MPKTIPLLRTKFGERAFSHASPALTFWFLVCISWNTPMFNRHTTNALDDSDDDDD